MSARALSRLRRLFGRSPAAASWYEQLSARLDEQAAAIARMHLALDEARLALDRRLLDHYALTELAQAELHLRADAIDVALSSADGPVAELLAAEGALIDGYVIHHTAELARQIAGARGTVIPTGEGIDLLMRLGEFDVVVPSTDHDLVGRLLRTPRDGIEPGVRALLARELEPGALAVDCGSSAGLAALAMAAAVGSGGRVVCFEPAPHVAACLRRTLSLNGFAGRAQVEEIALSNGSLDARLPEARPVALTRLDLQGGEPQAWRGADGLRAANPGIVFVLAWSASLLSRAGTAPAAFMQEIRAAGFAPSVVDTGDPAGTVAELRVDPAELEGATLLLRRA